MVFSILYRKISTPLSPQISTICRLVNHWYQNRVLAQKQALKCVFRKNPLFLLKSVEKSNAF